ncbi:MAG: hemolysin family protein [Bilifractor sp.]|nr:hemolysin family protein [Lachnospiraceae bacterium]MDY2836716.1 hemolysin family protein [Bilifractor sp.]
MDSGPWIWYVILTILMIVLAAVFTACESAVLALTDTQMEELEEEENASFPYLQKLKANSGRFLTSVHTLHMLCVAGSTVLLTALCTEKLCGILGIAAEAPAGIAVMCISILVFTVILMIFTNILPKAFAVKNPSRTACGIVGVYRFFSVIFFPLSEIISGISNGILKINGIDPVIQRMNVTEDQIKMMVDRGTMHGNINSDEQEMIRNVFEFDDISIDEICTHRKDVACLYEEDPLEEWEKTIHESRHDQFPVVRETPDNVLGILDAKDYFRLRGATQEEIMARAVDPAYFVPGSVKAYTMFQHMKTSGNYFAIVLDEYGGMDGVISMKDLLEVLVGDLTEDDEIEEPDDIIKISPTTWRIQGGASLDDVNEALGKDLPTEDYDTFGGYILGRLGYVPEDGSHFELDTDAMHIRVYRILDHRVENTLVTLLPDRRTDTEERDAKDHT